MQGNNDITAQMIFNQLQGGQQQGAQQQGAPNQAGQLVLICSAHSANGTSFIARSVAMAAAAHYAPLGQRVLLLDYDLYKQSQLQEMMKAGPVHGPYDASFGVTPFWQVRAGILENSPELAAGSYASLYLQDHSGLAVSAFRWDQVGTNQSVHVVAAPDYWAALRQNFAMVIVDGPAADRTNMSASLYPHMERVAVVAQAHNSASPQTLQMTQDIQRFGGHFAGLILNETGNHTGSHTGNHTGNEPQ